MTGNRTGQRLLAGVAGLLICTSIWAQEQYGPIKGGETIYSILKSRVLTEDLNMRQWALATMAMNPSAFGASVGDLRRGVMLTIPSPEQARRQWRRGLAMEAGQVAEPQAAAAKVQPVGVNEKQVPVPNPVWKADKPVFATPATPAVTPTRVDSTAGAADAPGQSTAAVAPPDQLLALDALQTSAPAFVDDPLYDTALNAVGAQPSADLLSRLLDLEASYAGDADYDYVLGVLLLDAGRPQDAIFALLRASQTRPQSLGIRLDLGRAYFEANDNESARSIFTALKQQSPPPAAAEVIDSYLQAIVRRASRYSPTWVSRIGLSSGYDSNANGATDLRSFLGFLLDEQSRNAESAFAELGMDTQFAKPLTPRWRWLLGGQARYRNNFDASEFNSLQYGLTTGLSYRRGGWELSARLGGDQLQIDGDDNATSLGLTAGWNWRLSPFTRLQSSARVGTVRYDDALAVRDVDQWLLATGINQRGQLALGTEYSFTVLAGQDEAVDPASPYSRDLGGAKAQMVVQMTPRVRLNASAQGLFADYEGLFFGSRRQDVQWSTVLGLELVDNRLPGWSVAPQLSYTENRSDVDLFEYDRWLALIRLSHSFD